MITIQREDNQKQGRYFDGRKYILVRRIEGYTMSGDFTQASLVQDHQSHGGPEAAWSVDLSYSYYLILDRSYIGTAGGGAAGMLPGKVTDGNAHVIGLTIGYKF